MYRWQFRKLMEPITAKSAGEAIDAGRGGRPEPGVPPRAENLPGHQGGVSPGSAHNPTVTGGRGAVLFLLPEGKIEFTK